MWKFRGEAGEKTPIFPAGKVAIWIAKQSVARQIYGCFEMVSPPAKTAGFKIYQYSENFKLHLVRHLRLQNSHIVSHPPPLIRALRRLRARTKWDSKNFKLRRLFPQAIAFCKQIEQQPNDVRTEFCGCLLKFEILCVPFFDPYKKPNGGEGRGGRNRAALERGSFSRS